MKTTVQLISVLLVLLTACNSSYYATSTHDDIYYSRQEAAKLAEQATMAEAVAVDRTQNQATPTDQNYGYESEGEHYPNYDYQARFRPQSDTVEYDQEGNTYITNHYYFDQADYYYSARIRRFHRYGVGFSYYDPFYTNMYWYTYDPFHYGVSIYLGYGALDFYYPGLTYWSWPYRYGYWGGPTYSYWGWGGSYWAGYHHGYWHGYRAGYWSSPYYYGGYYSDYQYVYNSRDRSNYYYGHQGSFGSITADGSTSRGSAGRYTSGESFAHRYENSAARNTTRTEPVSRNQRITDEDARGSRNTQIPGNRADERTERIRGEGVRAEQVRREGETVGRTRGENTSEIARPERTRQGNEETRQSGNRTQGGEQQMRQINPGRERTEERPEVNRPVRQTQEGTRTNTQETTRQQRSVENPGAGRQQTPAPEGYRPQRTPADYAVPGREQYQNDQQRYQRPQQQNQGTGVQTNPEENRPRSYTSPSYQQPRTNQQYRSPGTEHRPTQMNEGERRPQANPQRSTESARPQVNPQQQRPTQSRPEANPAPSRQQSNPSYSRPQQNPTPSRQQSSPASASPQSAPSRQQAAPASSPSRSSSPAVSSPSRSSGSSSSGSSSSGSSSGGSRGSSSESSGRGRGN